MARSSKNKNKKDSWHVRYGQKFANTRLLNKSVILILVIAAVGSSGYMLGQSRGSSKYPSITYCKTHFAILRSGAYNGCVGTVQGFLHGAMDGQFNVYLGFNWINCPTSTGFSPVHHPIVIDDKFGPQTTAYVKCYQAMRHLTADGIVGPLTYAAMSRDANTYYHGYYVFQGIGIYP